MESFTAVTEEDLAKARQDAQFRQQLLSGNLKILIDAMNRKRRAAPAAQPVSAPQLREGAEMAVRLADIISRLDAEPKR